MKRILASMVLALAAFLSGCVSIPMQPTQLVKAPGEAKALVTFVRPAVFFGDGMPIDIWDGPNYVGSLGAGSLIQHPVDPGKRLFMANAENWSYAAADLQAGKHYIIKANLFPGVITGRVALGTVTQQDPRLSELMGLKPMVAPEKDRKEASDKKGGEARRAIANFESGKVSSFATVLPGDGF